MLRRLRRTLGVLLLTSQDQRLPYSTRGVVKLPTRTWDDAVGRLDEPGARRPGHDYTQGPFLVRHRPSRGRVRLDLIVDVISRELRPCRSDLGDTAKGKLAPLRIHVDPYPAHAFFLRPGGSGRA